MNIKKYEDLSLIEPVVNEINNSTYKPYLDTLLHDIFLEYKLYVFGGAVRDPIINSKYGLNNRIKDVDILVDDSFESIDFDKKLKGLCELTYSKLGSPKWIPSNTLVIDIVPFSNATLLKNDENKTNSLETSLKSSPYTTSALAYSFDENVLYSCGAISSIDDKKIDVLYTKGEEVHTILSKLILYAERFDFDIGDDARKFICQHYTQSMDFYLEKHLEKNNIPEKYDYLINELRNICSQQS